MGVQRTEKMPLRRIYQAVELRFKQNSKKHIKKTILKGFQGFFVRRGKFPSLKRCEECLDQACKEYLTCLIQPIDLVIVSFFPDQDGAFRQEVRGVRGFIHQLTKTQKDKPRQNKKIKGFSTEAMDGRGRKSSPWSAPPCRGVVVKKARNLKKRLDGRGRGA